MTIHPPARELLLLAIDNGWNASLVHGEDTGGSPYVSVTAARAAEPRRVVVSWHTRDTGTYRLFSAMVGQGRRARDISLTGARKVLAATQEPAGPYTPEETK